MSLSKPLELGDVVTYAMCNYESVFVTGKVVAFATDGTGDIWVEYHEPKCQNISIHQRITTNQVVGCTLEDTAVSQ